MRRLDLNLGSAAEDLALDEALLLAADGSPDGEALRFWESDRPFVVLGVAGRLREEVNVEACEADGVPVLRRASGGGTVLQGPGCLNYALVLSLAARPELTSVTASYREILQPLSDALSEASGGGGLAPRGISDIADGELKISGNAQKRSRVAVLHHGTVLYDFDLAQIGRYLKEPPKQPEYRAGRSHREFLSQLPQTSQWIRDRIATAWDAREPFDADSLESLRGAALALVAERYGCREWTERF